MANTWPAATSARSASGGVVWQWAPRQQVGTHLMRAEFGFIQFTQGIFHVFFSEILDHPHSILLHISITDIPSFSHVILQVLPAAWRRKSWNKNSEIRSSCRRPIPPTTGPPTPTSVSPGELHTKPTLAIIITVPSVNCILSISAEKSLELVLLRRTN